MTKMVVKYYEDPEFYEYLKKLSRINNISFSELVRILVRLGLQEAKIRRLIKSDEGDEY